MHEYVVEKLNIPKIIHEIIKRMRFGSPEEINDDGYAGIFADKLEMVFGGPNDHTHIADSDTVDTRLPSHEWVVHKGLCYDSETPQGVVNPLDLPFFKRKGLTY